MFSQWDIVRVRINPTDRDVEKNPVAPTIGRAHRASMTKLAEIQSAILQLEPGEREELRHWLDETAEETPEMLAAIDQGLRSLKEKGLIPLEDVRQQLRSWTTKSV